MEEKKYDLNPVFTLSGIADNLEMQKTFVQMFIDTSEVYLNDILKAFDEKDADGLKGSAHALKSSLRQFRLDSLDDAIVKIEACGKANDLSGDLDKTIQYLNDELKESMAQMKQEYNL